MEQKPGDSDYPTTVSDINPEKMGFDISIHGGVLCANDSTGDTNEIGIGAGISNVLIEGCVFLNSHRKGIAPQEIYDNVTIRNCEFVNCRSGIELGKGGKSIVENCTIKTNGSTNNVTTSDASEIFGIHVSSAQNAIVNNIAIEGYNNNFAIKTETSIANCAFSNVKVTGGAVSIKNSSASIENSTINCSDFDSYIYLSDTNHVIKNCKINADKMSLSSENDNCNVIFDNCRINLTNEINNANIYANNTGLTIKNCKISGAAKSLIRFTNAKKSHFTLKNNYVTCNEFIRASFTNTETNFATNNVIENDSNDCFALYGNAN